MKPISFVLRALITLYQYVISPVLGPHCRYQPTCSHYAKEAIAHHGALQGGWLAMRRIGRCHPLGGHGYDPVPAAGQATKTGHGLAKEPL